MRTRTRIAITVWLSSVAIFVPLWLLVLRWVLLFASPSLAVVSSLILIAFLGVVALYLHAELECND